MKAPIRQLVEALDSCLHFLPDARVRQGREYRWLHSAEIEAAVLHYGAWVNFWGIGCFLAAVFVPLLMICPVLFPESPFGVSPLAFVSFLLCFPAVMLAVKFAGDAFICLAANAVLRFAPGAGCSVKPRAWSFRELRESYAWYCGVPRYWLRRVNRVLFLMAGLGVCAACFLCR